MHEVRRVMPQAPLWRSLPFQMVLESEEVRLEIVFFFPFFVLVTIENIGLV